MLLVNTVRTAKHRAAAFRSPRATRVTGLNIPSPRATPRPTQGSTTGPPRARGSDGLRERARRPRQRGGAKVTPEDGHGPGCTGSCAPPATPLALLWSGLLPPAKAAAWSGAVPPRPGPRVPSEPRVAPVASGALGLDPILFRAVTCCPGSWPGAAGCPRPARPGCAAGQPHRVQRARPVPHGRGVRRATPVRFA